MVFLLYVNCFDSCFIGLDFVNLADDNVLNAEELNRLSGLVIKIVTDLHKVVK